MKLIVGLGNPGKEYEGTRHNCGFMVIDDLANKLNTEINQSKFKGLYSKVKYHGEDVILLKPQTYMNLSGESVIAAMNFFKLDQDDIIVIYDDLDMPVGKLRLRKTGSAGGHNGIKNIIAQLGTQNFYRIKVGVGAKPKGWDLADYVLGRFSSKEREVVDAAIQDAADAVEMIIEKGIDAAMNHYNGSGKKKKEE